MTLGALGQSLNLSARQLPATARGKGSGAARNLSLAGLFVGPNLLRRAGTLGVAAAKVGVAEHILKWESHLDKLVPLRSALYLHIYARVSS